MPHVVFDIRMHRESAVLFHLRDHLKALILGKETDAMKPRHVEWRDVDAGRFGQIEESECPNETAPLCFSFKGKES